MASTQPTESGSSAVRDARPAVVSGPRVPTPSNGQTMDPQPGQKDKISYLNLPNKGQLIILSIARLADPLAATSIQSYMFYQLKFFNPSASDATISTQAGILVGAKTAAQVCTGMLWGRFADSELGGRKTVLLIGLICCCVSYIGYGLSKSFIAAIACQVFGGAMSSNVAIVRCVVAELNPEKRYRARALLLLPLFANAGNLLGPLVGGLLSSNARDGRRAEFAYPYLGPNLFVAAVYFIAAAGVFFGLRETLESLQDSDESGAHRLWRRIKNLFSKDATTKPSDQNPNSDEQATNGAPALESTPLIARRPKRKRKLPFRRIWTFNVICTMLSHFIIAGHLGTFSSLWSIFLSTPIGNPNEQHPPLKFNGGLGMLPLDVGFAMALLGAIGVILQLVIYPLLQDRYGTVTIWRTALLAFPIVYILAPFPSLVASSTSNPSPTSHSTSLQTWLSLIAILVLFVIGRTGVTPATTLLINDCTPHPSVRGTIHTAATVLGNLSRSIFPVIALSLFGHGLRVGVVGLGFWALAGVAVLACVASVWVREGSNGREIVLEDENEDDEGEGQGQR